MNVYRLTAVVLGMFLLFLMYSYVVKTCSCGVNCPNKVSWWQCSAQPGYDIPRPEACCPSGDTGKAMDQPSGTTSPPTGDTAPVVQLDHNASSTDLNDCSGATIKLPPYDGGMATVGTSCFVPGKSFIVDMPDCSPLQLTFLIGNDNDSMLANIYVDHFDNWSGGGIYPPNKVQDAPLVPPLPYPQPTNQFRFTLVSDTQVDVYYNGTKITSLNKPSFPVAWLGIGGIYCQGDAYGSFQ
jgi:hypothetical protein